MLLPRTLPIGHSLLMKRVSGAFALSVRLSDRTVEDDEGRPWVDVEFADGVPAGACICLRYRTSLYDSLRRLTIRFTRKDGACDFLMPAGLFGRGEWVGIVPLATDRVSIFQATTPGGRGFDVTSCSRVALGSLVTLGLSKSLLTTLLAMGLRLTGRRREAHDQLRVAVGSVPFKKYHEWRAASVRALDLSGLDAPRPGWRSGPHIRVVIEAPSKDFEEAERATIESLNQQCYPHWSVALVEPPSNFLPDGTAATLEMAGKSLYVHGDSEAAGLWADLKEHDIIAPLVLGDLLPPYAFAALAEYALGHVDVNLIYADEDSIDDHGRYVDPELKPDWSPVFQMNRPYVGRALYFRVSALSQSPGLFARDLQPADELWASNFVGAGVIGHIRRVLLTKTAATRHRKVRSGAAAMPASTPSLENSNRPYATIIIPIRDRADLLGACLTSLAATHPPNFEVLIVDNGSEEAATLSLFKSVSADPRIRILLAPGPFNFSELCNRAATVARGAVLVFLNNDTVALRPDWLSGLARWATCPDVGAVGAKLFYPSGRLQHGGIVIGLGGYAGHIESGALPGKQGYLGRLDVPHEVSAVTGACMAVEKAKFDAVAGFEVEKFPIELGDVDLCLRLGARGWRTIFTPEVTLVHHESATRGRTGHSEGRYVQEQRQFLLRWRSCIDDDPFFHPALSLTSYHPMLDR